MYGIKYGGGIKSVSYYVLRLQEDIILQPICV